MESEEMMENGGLLDCKDDLEASENAAVDRRRLRCNAVRHEMSGIFKKAIGVWK